MEIYNIQKYEHLRRKTNRVPNPIILKFNSRERLIESELPEQTHPSQIQPIESHLDLIQHCLSLPPVVGEEEYLSQIIDKPGYEYLSQIIDKPRYEYLSQIIDKPRYEYLSQIIDKPGYSS